MNNTLNLNSTFGNMSREDLENELINLKRINAAQLKKIDEHEQTLYALKRQLSTSQAMEEHFTCEIDLLQKNGKSETDELLKKISALEEEIHFLKQTNIDNVQCYETQLQTKNAELEAIVENTKARINETNRDEINKYADEICDQKFKIEKLTEQLLNCETKYEEVSLTNRTLTNQITELLNQLDELKNCLKVTKEELAESRELSRDLQEDVIVLQIELDKYNSLPMEKAAKGNSLFAEVDDSRVKLQKTMKTMKKKYMDMRTQYSSKCQELQKLHMEYAALTNVIEDKKDSTDEQSELIQTYENHFKRLNENVKSLENELGVQKHAFTKLISKDWKCAQEMISITRGELQSLQKKLNAESLGLITSESNHFKTKRDLKKWEAEAIQLRAQILSLNQIIDELKLLKSPPAITQEEISNAFKKSCLKKAPVKKSTPIDWEKPIDFSKTVSPSTSLYTDDSCSSDSISESNSIEHTQNNLMGELTSAANFLLTKEESNKENYPKENITNTNNIQNDTLEILTSKMKKLTFEENKKEPQRTGKLGVRKIIIGKVVHIP